MFDVARIDVAVAVREQPDARDARERAIDDADQPVGGPHDVAGGDAVVDPAAITRSGRGRSADSASTSAFTLSKSASLGAA